MARDISKYEQDYVGQHGFEKTQVQYRRRFILSVMQRLKPSRILEIGCGVEPLFQHVDFSAYTVVEPSDLFCSEANKKIKKGQNVQVIKGFFEEVGQKFEPGQFDFICLSSLLHEIEAPELMLQGIRRICDDKTVVHINVPNARSFHNLLAVKMGMISDVFQKSQLANLYQRRSTFDLASFAAFLNKEGFRCVETGSYFMKPFTHGQMQKLLDHDIIDTKVLDAFYDIVADFPGLGSEIYANVQRAET